MDSGKCEIHEKPQATKRSSRAMKRKKKRSKDMRNKRKKTEDKMSNGSEDFPKESFYVDMSKISRTNDAIVKVREIQQLILFSLLGPENGLPPPWAKLNNKCVKRVAVLLLKYVTPTLFTDNEECFPKLGSMFEVVFPFLNHGYLVFVKSPAHSILSVNLPKPENDSQKPKGTPKPLAAKDYILTETQLIKNDFLIPGLSKEAEDFFTIPRVTKMEATSISPLFALDCEMCMSARGRELTRISLVDQSLEIVYDSLVKPECPIIDYLTRYSGITEEDLCGVKTSLEGVQKRLKKIIPPDAIIVGHSLEFDFTSLKFFHNKVIDTSVIYDDGRGPGFKPSLKYLAKKYLKAVIQNDSNGHCSIEDARTCMKLVQLKIAKGPEFGAQCSRIEKSLFDVLSEKSRKKGVIVDRPSNIKQYSGSSDAVPCTVDEDVVSNVIKLLPKYDFVWSQLHSMDSLNKGNVSETHRRLSSIFSEFDWTNERVSFLCHADESKTVRKEKLKLLLQQMDANVSEIHENLPDGTLFVVILGSADNSVVKSLRERGASQKLIKKAEGEAKRGLCFVKLVSKSQEHSVSRESNNV